MVRICILLIVFAVASTERPTIASLAKVYSVPNLHDWNLYDILSCHFLRENLRAEERQWNCRHFKNIWFNFVKMTTVRWGKIKYFFNPWSYLNFAPVIVGMNFLIIRKGCKYRQKNPNKCMFQICHKKIHFDITWAFLVKAQIIMICFTITLCFPKSGLQRHQKNL